MKEYLDDFICLGIETSCDETSASVVKNGQDILSNVVLSQTDLHSIYGGVVPEIACRAHIQNIMPMIDMALQDASVDLKDITAIAVTNTPGLIGALLIGVAVAKSIALSLSKPLIAVDHVHAHIYASKLAFPDIKFPMISMVVSGGHTSLYKSDSDIDHKLIGSTRDDAAGEAFDKVAKILGLGFPGGPVIEKAARAHDPNKIYFQRSLIEDESFDFSFSGIKTAVLYKIRGQDAKLPPRRLTDDEIAEICSGFQEAVCDVLVEKGARACERYALDRITVGGGVACNKRLREKFQARSSRDSFEVYFPPPVFCTDNAAMVAGIGFHLYKAGRIADIFLDAIATKDYRK